MVSHPFGAEMESLQKLPNKVLLEIAGSFHLLLLLLVSQVELTNCSHKKNTLIMVLLRCTSTSEVKERPLSLMTEFQFLILEPNTPLHIHQ